MKDFNYYLDTIGEIGFIESSLYSIVYVSGLPNVHPNEIVIFETGDLGRVLFISSEMAEVLLLTTTQIRVGTKAVRTNENLSVPVGMNLLGRVINPLGLPIDEGKPIKAEGRKYLDTEPPKLINRKPVEKPLVTGVAIVDTVVPLGVGQRELVIGDRKTGKTEFLLQTITNQASIGTICIYAIIGQKRIERYKLYEYFKRKHINANTIIIASSSSDSSGLIYLTPFSAMTISEYFSTQGYNVLLVLDDLTTHAKNYRQISLLAKRFPGRSAYPGDIFYLHARLVERAGNFNSGSITCLPVAESLLGDLSGYIQTNLMAMTDGHIFFDIDLYNEGKRPAVNPFLSVTRVGHQTQTALLKDIGREVSVFLVRYERMKQFLHFGAEVGETARNILNLGGKIDTFFNQSPERIIPINANIIVLSGLWAGIWNDTQSADLDREFESVLLSYNTNQNFKKTVDELVSNSNSFSDIVSHLKRNNDLILGNIVRVNK